MANKKRQKRRFEISGELSWVHVVIFLVLCLVFVRETRFTFGGGLIKDIPDVGDISSEYLSNYENSEEGEGIDNHAAAGDDEEEILNDENSENESEGTVLRVAKGGGSEGHFTILDQMPEFEREDITMCDPDDDSRCFTIMDRNLGATTNDITSVGSYGYYYQWGNNYGFPTTGNVNTSSSQEDVSDYGPNNYYESSIWITNHQQASSYNHNLRGGSGDGYQFDRFRGPGTDEDRQGPCPNGYHIPSSAEWKTISDIWCKSNTVECNSSSKGLSFGQAFKLPFAGYRDMYYPWNNYYMNNNGHYRASNIHEGFTYFLEAYVLYFYSSYIDTTQATYSSEGCSIRCVKNAEVEPKMFTITFNDNGVDGGDTIKDIQGTIGWYTAGIGFFGRDRYNDLYNFQGWYTLPEGGQYIGKGWSTYAIKGPVELNLYAHREPRPRIRFLDGDDVILDAETYIDMYGTTDYGYYVHNLSWRELSENSMFSQYFLQKDGYVLLGWYRDKNLLQKFDFDNTTIAGDLDLFAKWQKCPNGSNVLNNKCISSNAGVYHKDGYIEIKNGEKVIYIKDKNQGAGIPSNGSDMNNLIEEYINCYGVPTERSMKRETDIIQSEYRSEEEMSGEVLKLCRSEEEIFGEASQLLGVNITSAYGLIHAYNKYEDDNYINSFGNYYFWGNNIGATYDELSIKNSYYANISQDTVNSGFNGGNIGELNGSGWRQGGINNPCDHARGEYLPTVGDWKDAIYLWAEIKGYDVHVDNGYIYPVNNGGNWQLKAFMDDILVPDAGYIYSDNNIFDIGNNHIHFNTNIYLQMAIDNGNLIGYFDGSELRYQDVDEINYEEFNTKASPIRCFLSYVTPVNVTFDMGEGETMSYKLEKGSRIIEPNKPTREGYTFDGWYRENGTKWNFEADTVENDIILYAKWEKEGSTSSSNGGGGGGGNSLKRDNCPNGDYSDSYYDGSCGKKPTDKEDVKEKDDTKVTEKDTEKEIKKHNAADEVVYDTLAFNPHYSDEMNQAYQYSYHYGITTKTPIKNASMDGKLTRVAMAKMLSQYAINVLGIEPDTSRENEFRDVSDKLDSDYDDGVTLAYQLGIMGINMPNNEFKPYNYVTRAEFATALSRLLYQTSDGIYESTSRYYVPHINKLVYEGILTNTDPNMKELRGYVMIMLMRSGSK